MDLREAVKFGHADCFVGMRNERLATVYCFEFPCGRSVKVIKRQLEPSGIVGYTVTSNGISVFATIFPASVHRRLNHIRSKTDEAYRDLPF